jgi:formylglycine-generating enzyme required for sulfatase activity/serine/threonine protein kinase
MIGTQVSHYRLTRLLGQGTYGQVFEGVHVHDDELRVAVKIVGPALAREAQFVDALKRECRQLDRMNHPNIVRFRELVVTDGGVAMVLELLRGQDLHARLAGGPLPSDAAVPVVEAILEGLGHAHGAGVLHRDIKPGNVYVCDDGRVVLLDFGIARAADGTQATRTGHMVGTFDYMAPERMSGSGGTASSDVYAVGLIAWELLTGRAACPEGEVARKLMWHVAEGVGDAVKVAATLPGCPPWLAEVIAALAARDPAARPADANAALALLREKRAGAGTVPAAAPSGRRPPPYTVLGPVAVGSVPPVAASVPPVSVRPAATGRSAPPGTVMGPAPSAPPPSMPPVASAPPSAAAAASSGASKTPLILVGALVLAGGAWWLGRSGGAPVASSGPTTTSFGYTLAPVPSGTHTIGSPTKEVGRSDDETEHTVTLTHGFWMGTTEITQGQYKELMGTNPVASKTYCMPFGNTAVPADNEPVYCVSWADAARLANAASLRERLQPCYEISGDTVTWPGGVSCKGYRLPTESEWEIAARGGGSGIYAGGNDPGSVAWFSDNSGGRTQLVGQKSPNGYGLYDMSGNVWEWTWDMYGDYPPSPVTDPTGATEGPSRVYRGGSWGSAADIARAAYRGRISPGGRYDFLGVRLSRTIP